MLTVKWHCLSYEPVCKIVQLKKVTSYPFELEAICNNIYSAKLETSLFYSRWSFVCVVATCSMYMYLKPWWCLEYDRVQFTRYARFTNRPVTGTVICTFCTCTLYMSSICLFSSCCTIYVIGAILKNIFFFNFSLFSICHGFPKTSEIRQLGCLRVGCPPG